MDGWHFDLESARQTLLDQLRVSSLDGFGLERRPAAVAAAGALVRHLRDTQKAELAHVRSVRLKHAGDTLLIDPTTLKHLEVVEAMDGGRQGSLLHEIDRTVTAMGGRLLRAWLLRPLVVLERIRDRLDAVEELAIRSTDRAKVRDAFKGIQDLERMMSRIALSTAGPRDLAALRASLAVVPRASLLLEDCEAPLVRSLRGELDELTDVRGWIESTIADEPPALARDGGFVRDGVDPGPRRSAPHQPLRQAGDRRDGRARARAHRHHLAEDPLQSRLRLLHRDLEVEPASRCRTTTCASRPSPEASASSRRR